MERVIKLRRFGNGDTITKSNTQQTPPPPKKRFGRAYTTYRPLTTAEKLDVARGALGVDVDPSLTENGQIFDLSRPVTEIYMEKPVPFDLGAYAKTGYFQQEYDPLTEGYRIYPTSKFVFDKGAYEDMMGKILSLPQNKDKRFISSYGYKPQMKRGGLFSPAELAEIEEMGKYFGGFSQNSNEELPEFAFGGKKKRISETIDNSDLEEEMIVSGALMNPSVRPLSPIVTTGVTNQQIPNYAGDWAANRVFNGSMLEGSNAYSNLDGTVPVTSQGLAPLPAQGVINQPVPNYNAESNWVRPSYFNGQIIQGDGSYSQYDENGNPETVWKNGEETSYTEQTQEGQTNPYDMIGAGLSIAGADIDMEGALFQLGQSLNFNADKYAPEYKNVARAGNIARLVGAVGKSVLAGARNINAGMGYQNRMQNYKQWYDNKEAERAKGKYQVAEDGGLIQYLASGGKVEDIYPEMLMSGDYTTGVKSDQPANAEVENGEYLQHPDGSVQQVVGKSHENGGEAMMLEEGTKVISDNLKIGKELSKDINSNFELKTKPTDTYATVIDKFKKKNKFYELEKEEEELLKKAEKNEKVKSASTKSLNKERISEQLNKLDEQKAEMQAMLSQFTSYIFQAQQEAKGEYDGMGEAVPTEQHLPTPEEVHMLQDELSQQMGTVTADEDIDAQQQEQQMGQSMSFGGLIEDHRFINLVKQSGLSPEKVQELYKSFKDGGYAGLQKFADGGKPKRETKNLRVDSPYLIERAEKDPEFAKQLATFFKYMRLNPYALVERDTQRYNKNTNLYGGIEDTVDNRMNWLYNKNEDLLDYYEDNNGKKRIKKGQEGAYQKKYAELSDKQVKRLVEKGYWTQQQADLFKDYISFMDKQDTARGFDAKVGDFTSSRSFLGIPIFKTEEEKKIAEDKGIFTLKQFRKAWEKDKDSLIKAGISKESFDNAKKELEENGDLDMGMYSFDNPAPEPTPDNPAPELTPEKEKGKPVTFDNPSRRAVDAPFDYLLFPDQTPLTPDGIVPHLMVDRTYERLDPVRISYEPQMVEGQRQFAQLQDSVASLPETARAAVLSNAMATTQQNLNNTIGQIQLANQQNEMQTEQFNIGQSNMEENARAQDLLNFEQRQLMAYENTMRDYNDWFEKVQNNRMREWETRNRMAQINQLTDNYKTDIFGRTRELDTGERWDNNGFALDYERLSAEVSKRLAEAKLAEEKAKALAAKQEHEASMSIVKGAIGKYNKKG